MEYFTALEGCAAAVTIASAAYAIYRWVMRRKAAQVVKVDKAVLKAWRQQAWQMYRHGDYDGAIHLFTVCITKNPRSIDAFNGRGKAYRAKGLTDLAIADFRRAVAISPNSNAKLELEEILTQSRTTRRQKLPVMKADRPVSSRPQLH